MVESIAYFTLLMYMINGQTDIWYYEPTTTSTNWTSSLSYNQITGNTICPGAIDNCWEITATDGTMERITSTTGFTSVQLTWYMATSSNVNAQESCHIEYSLTGNEPYTDIITATSKNYDSFGTYSGWSNTVDDTTGLRIRLRNKDGGHSCYYNQLRLFGITAAPTVSPTTKTPTTATPTMPTTAPTTILHKTISHPLNHTHLSVSGATVSILKDVTIVNNEWLLDTTDEIGFNLLLELDTNWAFSSTVNSVLNIHIYSDQPIPPQTDMIVAFSQQDSQYFATNIELDQNNNNGHDINPECLYYPSKQTYLNGNIQTIVSQNTGETIFKKAITSGLRPMLPIENSPNVNYPLTFTLNNYPTQNYMNFEYNNVGDARNESCPFVKMISDIPLKIYFAGEGDGAFIKYFDIIHTYYNLPIQQNPTTSPSNNPSISPTFSTINPSSSPSKYPSTYPSSSPSKYPSVLPSNNPTNNPSIPPTQNPSAPPNNDPSVSPTQYPSISPTSYTINPSNSPSKYPSVAPVSPTNNPSLTPSKYPSNTPSNDPSSSPTVTTNPSISPSTNPSISPSTNPSLLPTNNPSQNPSISPNTNPSISPTYNPSLSPTNVPSSNPTKNPIKMPTISPTLALTTDIPLGGKPSSITGNNNTWITILIIILIILICCLCIGFVLYKHKQKKKNIEGNNGVQLQQMQQLQSITAADSPTTAGNNTNIDGELTGTNTTKGGDYNALQINNTIGSNNDDGEGGVENTTKGGNNDEDEEQNILPQDDDDNVDGDGDAMTTNVATKGGDDEFVE